MDPETFKAVVFNAAIQGKLVLQDSDDESASVLVGKIREERQKLIKEGKIKKDKNISSIYKRDNHYYEYKSGVEYSIDKEFSYEIPMTWELLRLKDLGPFGGGKTPSTSVSEYWGGDINWVSSKEVKSKYITQTERKLTDLGAESMTIYPSGSLVFVMRSGILRRTFPVSILKKNSTVNQDIKVLECTNLVDVEFLYYSIRARERYILKQCSKDGTTVESIDDEKLKNLVIPIPPYNEQKRICEQIINLLSLSDTHNLIIQHSLDFKQLLIRSLLLTAIQGKLISQNSDESPVEIDYSKQIVRRENSYFESGKLLQVCFELPDSWKWARGIDLFNQQETAVLEGDWFSYIDIDSIDNNRCRIDRAKRIESKKAPSRAKRLVKNGDVLFSLVRPYLRNIALVTEEYDHCIASTGFFVCRSKYYDSDFLYYMMVSAYVVDGINSKIKGDNSPSVRKDDLLYFLYPVPPIQEQRRIADKLHQLFILIDQLP